MIVNSPAGLETVDEVIKNYLGEFVDSLRSLLKADLVGIYLHGSLTMGSYYKPKSDIDLIVVVESPLTPDFKKKLAKHFVHLAEERPTVGNIEVSVLTRRTASEFIHPCPFEVHYSSEWHEKILSDEADFSKNNTDPDLAAHFTYVKKRGVVLEGEAIKSVFGAVPWPFFIDSILDDFNWIVEEENILETPFYGVLNICRVMRTLSEKTENVYSKDEGGEWALQHVPVEHKPIVQKALDVYRSAESIDVSQRKQGGVSWDRERLLGFRDFAKVKVAGLVR